MWNLELSSIHRPSRYRPRHVDNNLTYQLVEILQDDTDGQMVSDHTSFLMGWMFVCVNIY